MKMLSLLVASGVWTLGVAAAQADTTVINGDTGAVTTPSGTETTTPPPATYDNGAAGTPTALPPSNLGTDSPAPTMMGAVNEPAPPTPPAVQPIEPEPVAAEGVYWGRWGHPRFGVGIMAGGGFEDFTGNIRNMTGEGGYWTARVFAGTRQFVGFEAAYVGDARGINSLGASSNARLVSNGAEGDLRLNVPIERGSALIEPFGFVGVGWAHYSITDTNAALSDMATSDDVLTLPYGGGLEFAYRGVLVDARYTYRQTYYNNLTQTIGGNLNNWSVGGQVGFEY